MHRSRLQRFRAAAAFATVLAIVALVAGCRGAEPQVAADATAHAQRVAVLWAQHCALCHVNGEGGAPRLGDVAEWQPRVAQGTSVLLQHTLEGFNNMPPLGYCMSCEQEDFAALIQFMAGLP
jgi:cytochrome c5